MINLYRLLDPITLRVRYIGQTINSLPHRLSQHLYTSRVEKYYVATWIRSLTKRSTVPIIELIVQVENQEEADFLETLLISYYKSIGYTLTNDALGGKGTNIRHSDETKTKISTTKIGIKFSPETRSKMSASGKVKVFTPEHRAKLASAAAGRKISQEIRDKMSTSKKGKPNGLLGRKHTPEAKANMSAARARYLSTR